MQVSINLRVAIPSAMLRHSNHLFNFLYFIGNSCCPTTVGGNFFPRFTPLNRRFYSR